MSGIIVVVWLVVIEICNETIDDLRVSSTKYCGVVGVGEVSAVVEVVDVW